MFALVVFSCNKTEKKTEVTKTNFSKVDTTKISISQLETFDFPDEVQGCSCYFAKNKEDFMNQKYIYIDDYGNNAYVKMGGKLLKIAMEEGDFDPDHFDKVIKSDDYTIKIKGEKLPEMGETLMYVGKIIVEKKSGEKITSTIYGECGC